MDDRRRQTALLGFVFEGRRLVERRVGIFVEHGLAIQQDTRRVQAKDTLEFRVLNLPFVCLKIPSDESLDVGV